MAFDNVPSILVALVRPTLIAFAGSIQVIIMYTSKTPGQPDDLSNFYPANLPVFLRMLLIAESFKANWL